MVGKRSSRGVLASGQTGRLKREIARRSENCPVRWSKRSQKLLWEIKKRPAKVRHLSFVTGQTKETVLERERTAAEITGGGTEGARRLEKKTILGKKKFVPRLSSGPERDMKTVGAKTLCARVRVCCARGTKGGGGKTQGGEGLDNAEGTYHPPKCPRGKKKKTQKLVPKEQTNGGREKNAAN